MPTNTPTDEAFEIASRIKTGTPYTITNRTRMAIWIKDAILEAEKRGAERERERASCYLEKVCWSDKDIQAFLDWGTARSERES